MRKNNNETGKAKMTFEFEKEFLMITAEDDSVEPVVKQGVMRKILFPKMVFNPLKVR